MSEPRCRHCQTTLGADGVCPKCLLDTGIQAGEQTAERLFRIALSYDAAERTAFIEQAAAADPALLDEVQMLLAGYAEAGGDEALPTLGGAANARSQWAAVRREEPGTVIDHFRLVRVIGEGGMGSVWEAEQSGSVKRRVALKIIKLGMDTEEVVRRFERERRTLALMTHPHIAQVYEAGATPAGRPYFAMELVEGQAITTHCAEEKSGVRRRLTLFLEVCAAVEYAHQKGIIHRDLKPSNILVSSGAVKVIDFGVAKATRDDGGDGLLTRQAQVLGTPAYMSPEQAESEGADVDTRTDVYSLGVVLYELLSGALPFDPRRLAATGVREMQRILREEQPPTPSTRIAHARSPQQSVQRMELHGDLDWIIMKALSKERERRYPSASAFADDLRRWLAGEVVSAAPPTLAYRFGKFVRRNRIAVAAVAAVVLSLAAGLIVSLLQVQRTNAALRGQTQARHEATFAVADMYARFGLAADEKGEPSRAALWFTNAAIIAAADPARVETNRLRAATWTAESVLPVRAFETGLPHIEEITFHPGGRALILKKINGGQAQIWDLETEQPSPLAAGGVEAAAWDSGGSRLCLSGGGKLRVLAWPSGELLAEHAVTDRAEIAFSPDGAVLAVGAVPPFLWEWQSGKTTPAAEVTGGLKRIRWSPDGRFVLWQSMDRAGICAAANPNTLLFPPVPNEPKVLADFIGSTGQFFHSPPNGDRSFTRDAATGQTVSEIPGGGYVLTISADGKLVARARAPLFQTDGKTRRTPAHHNNNSMEGARFSPDGRFLATAGFDAAVYLWSVAEDRPLAQVGWHQHPVQTVAFSPDGSLLATAQIGLVRVWRVNEDPLIKTVPVDAASLATLSGDGQWLAPSGVTQRSGSLRQTRVFATATGQPAGPELPAEGIVTGAAFAPDNAWLAVTSTTTPDRFSFPWKDNAGSGSLQLWDWKTGARLAGPVTLPSEPRSLAVHPSGDFIALYCGGGEGLEWERKTGTLRPLFSSRKISTPQHTLQNGRCAYADGGRFIVAWGELSTFHIWDRRAGRAVTAPPVQESAVLYDVGLFGRTAALSPAGPPSPMVRFLDLATGQEIAAPLAHSDWLYAGRFDETGDFFLTTGRRLVAQVWNWRKGTLTGPALPHESEVMAGLFVPGKPWVITGAHDGLVRFWDRHSGMLVRPSIPCPGLVVQLTLTPDTKQLIAAGFLGDGEIDIIDLTRALPSLPPALDIRDDRLLAEINAAAVVHEGGGLMPLTGEAWLEKWRTFRTAHPQWPAHRLDP